MTDYLDMIINKTADNAEIIQPRLKSRFESDNKLAENFSDPIMITIEQEKGDEQPAVKGNEIPKNNLSELQPQPEPVLEYRGRLNNVEFDIENVNTHPDAKEMTFQHDSLISPEFEHLEPDHPMPQPTRIEEIPAFPKSPPAKIELDKSQKNLEKNEIITQAVPPLPVNETTGTDAPPLNNPLKKYSEKSEANDKKPKSTILFKPTIKHLGDKNASNIQNRTEIFQKTTIQPDNNNGKNIAKIYNSFSESIPYSLTAPIDTADKNETELRLTENSLPISRSVIKEPKAISSPEWPTLPTRIPSKQSNEKAEPVVNVTIGRIEVKAIAPEDRQRKTAKKPALVMSLSEYLRQRANGER